MAPNPFELADTAAAALGASLGVEHHDAGIVLGSGWTPAAEIIGETVGEVAFSALPGFPTATVVGHAGVFRSVRTEGDLRVLLMMGRVHLYEGHPVETTVHGVRTMARAGCGVIALTNAAGGLRQGFAPGKPVLIRDHINFTGRSPLTGANDERYGPRFVDLTDAYSPRLRAVARDVDPSLEEGVYVQFPGPMYETPAEIEMVRRWGADLVGMSTVMETIAARHLGAEVLGLSLVTNLAAGITGEKLNHEEVLDVAKATAARMGALLRDVIARA